MITISQKGVVSTWHRVLSAGSSTKIDFSESASLKGSAGAVSGGLEAAAQHALKQTMKDQETVTHDTIVVVAMVSHK